eukprot:TRINITY_DN5184_c0_g1_i3.p1 TRINITY_DN5184_c0_g1~~TRINITY_DN5184_c0_g1_i3.p1  ORF type:complete len:286 (+),score=2.12 TRINITY_DN5184_c0_g1_i3:175-1032(+)
MFSPFSNTIRFPLRTAHDRSHFSLIVILLIDLIRVLLGYFLIFEVIRLEPMRRIILLASIIQLLCSIIQALAGFICVRQDSLHQNPKDLKVLFMIKLVNFVMDCFNMVWYSMLPFAVMCIACAWNAMHLFQLLRLEKIKIFYMLDESNTLIVSRDANDDFDLHFYPFAKPTATLGIRMDENCPHPVLLEFLKCETKFLSVKNGCIGAEVEVQTIEEVCQTIRVCMYSHLDQLDFYLSYFSFSMFLLSYELHYTNTPSNIDVKCVLNETLCQCSTLNGGIPRPCLH